MDQADQEAFLSDESEHNAYADFINDGLVDTQDTPALLKAWSGGS